MLLVRENYHLVDLLEDAHTGANGGSWLKTKAPLPFPEGTVAAVLGVWLPASHIENFTVKTQVKLLTFCTSSAQKPESKILWQSTSEAN